MPEIYIKKPYGFNFAAQCNFNANKCARENKKNNYVLTIAICVLEIISTYRKKVSILVI